MRPQLRVGGGKAVGRPDDQEFELTCPNGHRVTRRVSHLRGSPTFGCPTCGAHIRLDRIDIDQKIRASDWESEQTKRRSRQTWRDHAP
jgi:hypothetical protein